MENKNIHLIYQVDYMFINPDHLDERLELSEMELGYFEGTEEEAQALCERLENQMPRKYKVPSDNEHLTYPMVKHTELKKLT
ncbi:hypothetical protein [Rummeliibacillus stabekisii]|uniref:hypothetical protein n=1 Tax=Rummeliibacillus stabekisii TaxID=241244 RepID=UPI003721584E